MISEKTVRGSKEGIITLYEIRIPLSAPSKPLLENSINTATIQINAIPIMKFLHFTSSSPLNSLISIYFHKYIYMIGVNFMIEDIRLEDSIDVNNKDVPFQLIGGGSHIEVFGNRRIEFEGKYKILEYSEETFKIKRSKGTLTILGTNLSMCNVQKTFFSITGDIKNIAFE